MKPMKPKTLVAGLLFACLAVALVPSADAFVIRSVDYVDVPATGEDPPSGECGPYEPNYDGDDTCDRLDPDDDNDGISDGCDPNPQNNNELQRWQDWVVGNVRCRVGG